MSFLTNRIQSLRQAVFRFATRRAAHLAERRPQAAVRWLQIAARWATRLDPVHRQLVDHYRRLEQRMAAVAVGEDLVNRFGDEPDAWMILGECYAQAYRPRDALAAYEQVLVIEERAAAALAAGELYARVGDHATAGARYARAFAAGAGPDALRLNALELQRAGDPKAAAQARMMWEKETGKTWVPEPPPLGAGPARG